MLSPGVLSTSTPVVSTNQGKDLFGLPHFHYSGIPSDTKIHLKASRTSHLLDIPVFLEGISSSLPLSSLERPPGSEPQVPSGRWSGHISMLISTGVGCHFLLQKIFPTQGSNPGLPHCRQTLSCLSHQGSRQQQRRAIFNEINKRGTWVHFTVRLGL